MTLANALIIHPNQTPAISETHHEQVWFPDFDAARRSVAAHVATLGSTTETEEQHTLHDYRRILDTFISWLGYSRLPDERIVKQYIGELRAKGIQPQTVNKYLTVIKHFCAALASQHIWPTTDHDYTADDRFALSEARQFVANVRNIKGLRAVKKSNLARLDQFNWHSADELHSILDSIDRSNLPGKRDYAIFVVALNSAIRVSELSRLTLANFKRHSDNTALIINLRGKGNNYDPIPLPLYNFRIVQDYFNAYNAAAPADRAIQPDEPLWQPLTPKGNILANPHKPLSRWGISAIIQRRSAAAGHPMNAHDTRRSATAYMRAIGMDHNQIRHVTRHQSLDMVAKYVGQEMKYDDFNHALISGRDLR